MAPMVICTDRAGGLQTTRRRALLALSSFLGIALAVACAPSIDEEEVGGSAEALARRDMERPPPGVRKPDAGKKDAGVKHQPPSFTPIGPLEVSPSTAWCGTTRYDLRRLTRTCEDLPGAWVEGGATYVPGTAGRFKVERPLAASAAPPSLVERTCAFTWEPQTCGALPDTAKLLVEEPTEQIVPRSPGCDHLPPGGCMIKSPPPTVDGGTPTGVGRCEVCGFATDRHLWAVLPDDWTSFSYSAGGQRRFVQLSSTQRFYDVSLGAAVVPQDVTIYKYDSAPQ